MLKKKRPLSKSLSKSTLSMATSVQTLSNATSTTSLSTPTSISGQKKFQRYFSQAPAEEYVLKYYRCALVADILWQGSLFITQNYFGFYSNLFGHVTRILIPTASVVGIRKQRTVKIIPNAIAVDTNEERYVFCSFFARDSAFKLMKQVLENDDHQISVFDGSPTNEDRLNNSQTQMINDTESDRSSIFENEIDGVSAAPQVSCQNAGGPPVSVESPSVATKTDSVALPRPRLWRFNFKSQTVIVILVVLLAVLYLSAAMMMIRIDRLHAKYLNHPLGSSNNEILIRNGLSQHLKSKLDQIVEVRQSLQTLSQKFASITEDAETVRVSRDVMHVENVLR